MTTSSDDVRNAKIAALNTILLEGAGTNSMLKIRDSVGTDLISINLDPTNPIATAVAGVADLNPPAGEASWINYESTVLATGIATESVLTDTDGNVKETITVSDDGTGEVDLPSLDLVQNMIIRFTAAPTYTQIATYTP